MEQIISRLIDLVQQTAPQLWQIARQQVYAQTITAKLWLGVGLLALIGIISINLLVFRAYRKHNVPRKAEYSDGRKYFSSDHYWDEDNKIPIIGFSIGISAMLFVMCLVNLNNAIIYTLSPDYYAIQVLLQLAK